MTHDTLNMQPLAEEATRLIKALAHPERLMICCQLRDGELEVVLFSCTVFRPC